MLKTSDNASVKVILWRQLFEGLNISLSIYGKLSGRKSDRNYKAVGFFISLFRAHAQLKYEIYWLLKRQIFRPQDR